jgi:wyosine [tRNA(Phe)-imidazoG37] synthetase (radical SAM superfamily)
MRAYRYLYGPVPSRRLGRSLGIDLVPHKVCTYNCIYCQVGRTTEETVARKEYIPGEEVLEEVRSFLSKGSTSIDHLSLSGSGEPTLHSQIRSIIEGIKRMSETPLAVLTNGSLLYDPDVREDLLSADVILPSLDAVSQEVFRKINRPPGGFSVDTVIEGIVEFRRIYRGQLWLEILFCRGVNDGKDELERMKKAIDQIRPDRIHLNTVVRPPAETWARPLSAEELEKILAFFGERASIITEFDRHLLSTSEGDRREKILEILKRRPLSHVDLSKGMGIPLAELEKEIHPLVEEGRIRVRAVGESIYYEIGHEEPVTHKP